MKTKFTVLISCLLVLAGQAQKRTNNKEQKCVLYNEPVTKRDLFKRVDTHPVLRDTLSSEEMLVMSEFNVPDKKYKPKATIRFAWIVEKDGRSTFVNVWYPDDIPEISVEAKRFVESLPLYKPATCAGEAVAYKMDIEFPVSKEGLYKIRPEPDRK